jgi:hypothetical protein
MTKNGRALSEGCYAVIAPDGAVFIESSEIRALRKAVSIGADVRFVKWGHAVSDVDDSPAEPAPRKPRASKAQPATPEPTPEDIVVEVKAENAAAAAAAIDPVDPTY